MQEIDAGAMHVQEVAPEAAVAGDDAIKQLLFSPNSAMRLIP